jgi:hypothetical protein
MAYVFAFAGIPAGVYDAVYDERRSICGDNAEFLSSPARNPTHAASAAGQVDSLLKTLASRVRTDHHNVLADTAFALIGVGAASQTAAFTAAFPAVLAIPVEWELDAVTPTVSRRSRNELISRLRNACATARGALKPLSKELREKDNRTPLLLPLRNFSSGTLVGELTALHETLSRGGPAEAAINAATQAVNRRHPPQQIEGKARRCYVDRRRVEFHAPGSARHAYARPTGQHPDICILAGSRRFGAPFDRAFHYDCSKGVRNLKGRFTCCHAPETTWTGDPHLNISPSDYIRV